MGDLPRDKLPSLLDPRRSLASIVFLLTLATRPAQTATAACTRDASRDAEAALTAFERKAMSADPPPWRDFEQLVDKHRVCDDGFLAEMFAEISASMLIRSWDGA